MRGGRLALVVVFLVVLDVLLAVYVFSYTTEALEPRVQEQAGITVIYAVSGNLMTIGREDGWIINPFGSYQNDAPITSLLMTDDGLIVAFADAESRVHLLFSGGGVLLWSHSFDGPVEVVEMWARQGPLFLEPTYILVSYEGGLSLLNGASGTTAWSYRLDGLSVIRTTETGKILVASGSRVNFFWLGSGEPYRWVPIEGPVDDLLSDVKGNRFLLVRTGEVVFYDGITGDVQWRKEIEGSAQVGLSWDGEKSYVLSRGRLVIVSGSGQELSSVDVGEGRLLAPSVSSHYFMLGEDRIDAYHDGRPAPIWTASIGSAFEAYSTPGGTLIFAWTSERLFLLNNANPPVASKAGVGIFGTVIAGQLFLPLLFVLMTYALPNLGDLVMALLIGSVAGVGALLAGTLETFEELGVGGALVAVVAASAAAFVLGRRSGSPLSGSAIGLLGGGVGFLAASLLIAFYRYVFDFLPVFPAVEVTIRALSLGWLLGMVGGFLGGLSTYFIPDFLRSASSRG